MTDGCAEVFDKIKNSGGWIVAKTQSFFELSNELCSFADEPQVQILKLLRNVKIAEDGFEPSTSRFLIKQCVKIAFKSRSCSFRTLPDYGPREHSRL
ncbi:MAG: hypothetical protein V1870_02240 [Candidatus Aenigmatarchaeota archaeon]